MEILIILFFGIVFGYLLCDNTQSKKNKVVKEVMEEAKKAMELHKQMSTVIDTLNKDNELLSRRIIRQVRNLK